MKFIFDDAKLLSNLQPCGQFKHLELKEKGCSREVRVHSAVSLIGSKFPRTERRLNDHNHQMTKKSKQKARIRVAFLLLFVLESRKILSIGS